VSTISKEISDKSAKEKYTFEIITIEGDNYIFKSRHNADLESWMESISTNMKLIRENKLLIKYGEQINKLIKDSYQNYMYIIYRCLSLKTLLSIKEGRDMLLK
jgi:hypothetical protein